MRVLFHFFLTFVLLTSHSSAEMGLNSLFFRPTLHTYEDICSSTNIVPSDQMSDICKIVTKSEICKKIPEEDLLRCDNIEASAEFDSWGLISGCATGAFNSAIDKLSFVWDVMKFAWENATSSETRDKNLEQASEYMSTMKLYLNTEYQKALARSTPPLKEAKAIASMSGAVGKLVLNAIMDQLQKSYQELGCMSFKAKSKFVCDTLGDIFIPPAAVIALLKYGPQAVKSFPKLVKLFRPRKLPTEGFALLVTKYPNLKKSLGKIGSKLPYSYPIDDVKKIPYWRTNNFRPASAPEMKKRAADLDPETAKDVVAAYNALNDTKFLKPYMEKLFAEAAEWMAKKGRPEDLKLLEQGIVSEQALAVIIIKRMKQRGDTNFTTINPNGRQELATGKIEIDPSELATGDKRFRAAVRTGPFIDKNFSKIDPHGRFTHLIQRDIVHEALMASTNGNPQRFWDFMGSKKGINFWVDVFDSENKRSFSSPEVLNQFIADHMTGAQLRKI